MTHIQKKFGRRLMKCTRAMMRRAIAHQEKAKNRNDPMLKAHYSMQPGVGKITKERS